jgi:hypothetical protein
MRQKKKALDRENNPEVAKVRSADLNERYGTETVKMISYQNSGILGQEKMQLTMTKQLLVKEMLTTRQTNKSKQYQKREELGSRERVSHKKQLQIASTNKNA